MCRRCVCQVCPHACASQWPGVRVCIRRRTCCFFLCLGTRPAKENRSPPPHEDSMAAGRRQSLLVCVPVLSSPVSCQNRKGQGREWRLGKRCLDVCWLEVQLCLTVTLLARKNRPVQGVTRSGILHGVIFITFTKHSEGCFPQLLTQVRVIFVSKTVRQRRDVPSSRVPLAGSLALDCSLCLGREILFDILLIMKARNSFSLDDPETSITIPFP